MKKNNDEPLVSIIIPVYNAELYIRRCLDSIISQTYKNIQIIVIDDGSTDKSNNIIREYVQNDSRIILLQQENQGSVLARRNGVEIATGKYIEFVDADDFIEVNTVQELILIAQRQCVDIIQFGYKTSDETVYCAKQDRLVEIDNKSRIDFINSTILNKSDVSYNLWSKLFDAAIIKEALWEVDEEQNYGEDFLCLCNCLLKVKKIYITSKVFYHYSLLQGSLSHKDWLDNLYNESELYKSIIMLFQKRHLEKCIETYRIHYKWRVIDILENNKSFIMYRCTYTFGNMELIRNKRVVIYGAGKVGTDYYYQIILANICRVVAWVDQKYKENYCVQNPTILASLEFDILIIGVKDGNIAREIQDELLENKLVDDADKIVWLKPDGN